MAVRGDYHAHVYFNGFVSTDALDFPLLEYTEQFRLHGHGHVANFVEEKRAGFGLFEFAEVARSRAGEGTFFVAEKFGLDQFRGDGRTIERDEGMLAPRRLLVNRARDEFFSRSGFAENADARFAGETGTGKELVARSEEHTSELQSRVDLVCRLLLE